MKGGALLWSLSTIWIILLTVIHLLLKCKCIYSNGWLWRTVSLVAMAGIGTSVLEIVYLAQEPWTEDLGRNAALVLFFFGDIMFNIVLTIKFQCCPQSC